MIEKLNYNVDTAIKGEIALEKYQQKYNENNPYDLVILDLIVKDGMGGRDTMDNLLKLNPQVNAVVASGYSNDDTLANFRNYGFKGILQKPFMISELSSVLSSIINDDL